MRTAQSARTAIKASTKEQGALTFPPTICRGLIDSRGIVHTSIGKVSFGKDKLVENAEALLDSVKSNKPSSIKGPFIEKISVNSTMAPGIRVQL